MKSLNTPLADFQHPLVSAKAKKITANAPSDREKLKRLFFFVRDTIKFGFPLNGDLVKASETLIMGMGQCNTKGTLFLALCRAVDIPARIHFSLIKKDIQKGLFTGLMYKLMPDSISHSWIEVYLEGKWRKLDSFINDQPFYFAGKKVLKEKGWDTGYSVSCAKGESSAEFNIDEEKFVQMDAVVEDQGIWDDPADYYKTDLYKNRPSFFKLLIYRLFVRSINRRVENLRSRCPFDPDCLSLGVNSSVPI